MSSLPVNSAIKLALEEMLEGIQIIDFDWRYIYINQAGASHGRKRPEDLVGKTMQECYPGIEETHMFKVLQQVKKTGQPMNIENEFIYETGEKIWFELIVEPYSQGILVRSVNIMKKKFLEEQLRQAQKMEAVGQLAGGVAHDFNNKLSIMMSYTDLALNQVRGRDQLLEGYLLKIQKAIHQSTAMTKRILAFSRQQTLDVQTLNLNTLLAESLENFTQIIGHDIRLEYRLAHDLKKVSIDPAQMEEVVLNLLINARDAMPEGGSIHIETENTYLDEEFCRSHPPVVPGSYVHFSFKDSGCGMDKETLRKAFDPFFTTKDRNRGTGLGLSMVHGFVSQSHGYIWASSEVGKGTVFHVYLPTNEKTNPKQNGSSQAS